MYSSGGMICQNASIVIVADMNAGKFIMNQALTYNQMAELSDLIAKKVSEAVLAMASPGKWLNLEEAKEYARVESRGTIMKWINQGHIYGFKRSGSWIIDRESIDQWYSSERGY